MLTRRWGTLVVVVAWVASWGLLFVHGAFALIPSVLFACWFIFLPWVIGRFPGDSRNAVPPCTTIFLPVSMESERHNARARLRQRIATLAEGKRACQELIDTATEEEATRIPVLEAERDAAEREITRLWQDIHRLEAGWKREDRERKYKELVG